MWLCLQSYADVLNGSRKNRVRYTRDRTGCIVLSIREIGGAGFGSVGSLELAAGIVEASKLNRDLGCLSMSHDKKDSDIEKERKGLTQAPMPMRGVRVPCRNYLAQISEGNWEGNQRFVPCRMPADPRS